MAAEVQMPFGSCVLVLVLADQSDQEVVHGFIAPQAPPCPFCRIRNGAQVCDSDPPLLGSCSRPVEATSQHIKTSNFVFPPASLERSADSGPPGCCERVNVTKSPSVESLREPKSKFSTEISAR